MDNSQSFYKTGYNLYFGEGVEQSVPAAFEYLLRSADEEDNLIAQCAIPLLEKLERKVAKSKRAEELLERATSREGWLEKVEEEGENGDLLAQFVLGHLYLSGKEVEKSFQKSRYWFEKGAEQGFHRAQFKIGVLAYQGRGMKRSLEQSRFWFQKSAEQGNISAQFNLAKMYQRGDGGLQSIEEAVHWYEKAAKKGQIMAQFELGKICEDPELAPQAFPYKSLWTLKERAASWYKKAARAGKKQAQYRLARLYDRGEGVIQSDEKALHWYKKAAEQGDEKAAKAVQRLEKKNTED